jgi:hypothetical protein
MYGKLFILFIATFFLSIKGWCQTYNYSYTDPCTGLIKTVAVQSNGINLTVYGQSHFFQQQDFLNGNVALWAQSVVNSFGGVNPCASLVGIPTAINITQDNSIKFLNVINSLSSISDVTGSSDIISSSVGNVSNSGGNYNNNSDNNNNNNNNNNNSGGSGSGGYGGSNASNNSGSSNNSSGTEARGINTTGDNSGSESGGGSGSVNGVGSSVNSTKSASNDSKSDNKPTILASSDLVGFNFKNTDVNYGGKFSGSFVSTKWDGSTSHGFLFDYTTSIKGPNLSGFYALNHKSRIDLISTSLTLGFDTKFSVYGTIALGQMWKFKKIKKFKVVYIVTGSYGSVYETEFLGTAFIAGSMYDMKISKRIEIKMIGLYVYAPYVRYYSDILLKSPNVILPILGTNIGITKRFKLNINLGGAYAINVSTLNYTIMIGTRFVL